ncbi:MAG: hypothetical protein Kow00103_11890 [Candidatus Caldatribacteriota bacterium]
MAGIVPHHLLAAPLIDSFFYYLSTQNHPHTILILSPDHFLSGLLEKNNSFLTPDLNSPSPELKQVKIDVDLGKILKQNNQINVNQAAILAEHGVMELIPYLKKYLPDTMVLPLLVPAKINRGEMEKLVETINQKVNYPIILIASVDFSHFLPRSAADLHDARSIRVIINWEKEHFNNLEVDCWQALYGIRYFAHLQQKEKFKLLAHQNSDDFLTGRAERTTSYLSAIFEDNEVEESILIPPEINDYCTVKTILVVGDMMLNRQVEELSKKNGIYYPFQKIKHLLKGVDIVAGNLEGPVMEVPPESPHLPLKFSFSPQILRAAIWSNFNLFSLANNHILDRGKEGLKETRKWLKQYGIDSVGDPLQDNENNTDHYFSDNDLIILAFNQIPPYLTKEEEIIKIVENTKFRNPNKFLIVILHWGEEYTLFHTSQQQALAHHLIEKGADLIIGHHPHMVQDIEIYQGKAIFYSLGNFIFDQNFSTETQEGLAVGGEIYTDKVIYRLFPIQITQSQPILMDNKSTNNFLKKLADHSTKEISKDIESVIIKLMR